MAPPTRSRLITIPFSHYCEKARWGLDHTGIPYVEDGYLPLLHALPARRAGGRTVPVLVTPGTAGKVLTDSADILLHCDAEAPAARKLYPADPAARRAVDELEALCNGELGVSARLFAYHHTLSRASAMVSVLRPGLTAMQARLFPFAVPFARVRIRRMYKVNEANAEKALATTRRAFEAIGAKLGSKRWLVGDGLTAADVTFASLAAPLLLPPGHPAMASSLDPVAEPLRSIIVELRATRAGEHALRLYREERHAKIA